MRLIALTGDPMLSIPTRLSTVPFDPHMPIPRQQPHWYKPLPSPSYAFLAKGHSVASGKIVLIVP